MFLTFIFANIVFLFLLKLYLKLSCGICKCSKHLVGKTAIVTGASCGIGFETAKDLAARGAKVIITSTNVDRGNCARNEIIAKTGNRNVHFYLVDFNYLSAVKSFANKILDTEEKLHILINNAGATITENIKTEDGLLQGMQINYFAPFLLTVLLLPLLKSSKPSRIINVTSMAHTTAKVQLDDLNQEKQFNSTEVYKTAKLCTAMITAEMARLLNGEQVTVNCLHPGFTNTEPEVINGKAVNKRRSLINLFLKNSWEGAQTSIYLAVSPDVGNTTGQYFRDCQVVSPIKLVQDKDATKKLWELSNNYVKIRS